MSIVKLMYFFLNFRTSPLFQRRNAMSIFGCLFPCAPQLSWRSAIESERCMSERMGASASASQGADGLGLNQGLGLPPGLEPPGSREKKKRVTGFATLKKKFIRRRRLVLLLKFC